MAVQQANNKDQMFLIKEIYFKFSFAQLYTNFVT